MKIKSGMRIFAIIFFLSIFTLSSVNLSFAQDQGVFVKFEQVITTDFPEVNVYASIYDSNGQPISGIAQEDIILTEDDIPVDQFTFTEINNTDAPIAFAVIIDTSDSMNNGTPPAIDNAKLAAEEFITKLQDQDSVAVISFNNQVNVDQGLTTEKASAVNAVQNLTAIGGTAMYDAIYQGVDLLKDSGKKNVIILITDGEDSSSAYEMQEVIDAASEWHVSVYPIGFGSVLETRLQEIAEQTGGFSQKTPDSSGLTDSFIKISNLLRNQYKISYQSTLPADDSEHQLELTYNYAGEAFTDDAAFIPKPLTLSLVAPVANKTLSIETELVAEVASSSHIAFVKFLVDDEEIANLNYPTEGETTYKALLDLSDVSIGQHQISVLAQDILGNTNEGLVSVQVREPIIIDIVSPEENAAFKTSPTIKVEVDSVRNLESTTIMIDGQAWESFEGTTFEEIWQIQALQDGTYIISVQATDVDGRQASKEITVFIGDAPRVVDQTPESEGGDEEKPGGIEGPGTTVNSNQMILFGGIGLLIIMLVIIVPILLKKKRKGQVSESAAGHLILQELQGLNPGSEWPLLDAELKFGRKREDNDIALQGRGASRRMAVIRKMGEDHIIYSLNPTNPIMINNHPISQQALLEPGDQIAMGESIFIVTTKPTV